MGIRNASAPSSVNDMSRNEHQRRRGEHGHQQGVIFARGKNSRRQKVKAAICLNSISRGVFRALWRCPVSPAKPYISARIKPGEAGSVASEHLLSAAQRRRLKSRAMLSIWHGYRISVMVAAAAAAAPAIGGSSIERAA